MLPPYHQPGASRPRPRRRVRAEARRSCLRPAPSRARRSPGARSTRARVRTSRPPRRRRTGRPGQTCRPRRRPGASSAARCCPAGADPSPAECRRTVTCGRWPAARRLGAGARPRPGACRRSPYRAHSIGQGPAAARLDPGRVLGQSPFAPQPGRLPVSRAAEAGPAAPAPGRDRQLRPAVGAAKNVRRYGGRHDIGRRGRRLLRRRNRSWGALGHDRAHSRRLAGSAAGGSRGSAVIAR